MRALVAGLTMGTSIAHRAALITLAVAVIASVTASPASAKDEKHWQRVYCSDNGTKLEYRLSDGARIDCLTPECAIEVDYVDHWAESVGQALYYAKATGKAPGILLLCPSSSTYDEGRCRSFTYRLFDALALVRTPVVVWMCFLDTDRRLSDCIQPHH